MSDSQFLALIAAVYLAPSMGHRMSRLFSLCFAVLSLVACAIGWLK